MNISPVNFSFPKYKPAFKGGDNLSLVKQNTPQVYNPNLYHFLKKRVHNLNEINAVLKTKNDDEKYIGSLPENWIKSFNPEEIKEKTSEIMHIFSDFALDSISTESNEYNPKEDKHLERLKQKLCKALDTDCEIKYINSGSYGRVYRIQALDEDVALKIFYSDKKGMDVFMHGNTIEVSNAVALNHTLKPNQCSKFYCAKINIPKDNDGFMLTSFVHKTKKKYPELKDWDYSRFLFYDARRNDNRNFIDGKLIDYGDVRRQFYSFKEQELAKKIFPCMKKQDIEGLKKVKEEYEGDEDWEKYCKKLTFYFQSILNQPKYFAYHIATKMQPVDIELYRVLGIDYSPVENYDFSKFPQGVVKNVRRLGFDI